MKGSAALKINTRTVCVCVCVCVCTCKYYLTGITAQTFSPSPSLSPPLSPSRPLTNTRTHTLTNTRANPCCNEIQIIMVIDLWFINNTLVHHPLRTLPVFSLSNNKSSLYNCSYTISKPPGYQVRMYVLFLC